MGGGCASFELAAAPLRLWRAGGRRHLGLPCSQARCNPFQTRFCGSCVRAPFSRSAPSPGEAAFGFASFETPLGRRAGGRRAEPGVGPSLLWASLTAWSRLRPGASLGVEPAGLGDPGRAWRRILSWRSALGCRERRPVFVFWCRRERGGGSPGSA